MHWRQRQLCLLRLRAAKPPNPDATRSYRRSPDGTPGSAGRSRRPHPHQKDSDAAARCRRSLAPKRCIWSSRLNCRVTQEPHVVLPQTAGMAFASVAYRHGDLIRPWACCLGAACHPIRNLVLKWIAIVGYFTPEGMQRGASLVMECTVRDCRKVPQDRTRLGPEVGRMNDVQSSLPGSPWIVLANSQPERM